MTRACSGCGRDFTALAKQRRYCMACLKAKEATVKRAYQFKQPGATFDELNEAQEAEVDRRFRQALAEIRRSGVHRVEAASWNYSSRYREP